MKKSSIVLKAAVGMLGSIPITFRSFVGRLLGCFISFFPTREREITRLQLYHALGKVPSWRLIAKVYANIGQTVLESINLNPILKAPQRYVSCSNWEYIHGLVARGMPVVALTAHTSNWDLLAAYMIKSGIPITTAGRAARKAVLQPILSDIRAQYGIKTLWRDSKNPQVGALREFVSDLRQKRLVAALIDQDTEVSSKYVPFFGKLAKTPSSLVDIGKRVNAVFLSAFIIRTGFLRYAIYVKEIDSSLDTEQILREYTRRLESYLCSYPDQWVWFHKRWRSLPDGTKLSTQQYLSMLKNSAPDQATSSTRSRRGGIKAV